MTDYNDLEIPVEDFCITPPAMASLLLSAYNHFKRAKKLRINRVEFGPLAADPRRRDIQIAALCDAIRTYPQNIVRVSYSTYTCASERYFVYAIMQFTQIQDEIVEIHRDKWHKEEMTAVLTGADKFQTDLPRKTAEVFDEVESFEYAAVLYCIFAVPSLYARVKSKFATTHNRGRVSPTAVAAVKAKHPDIDDCFTVFCAYFTKLCGHVLKPHNMTYDRSCGSFIFESTRISDEAACIVDYVARFDEINPSLLQYVTTITCDACNAVTDKKITTGYGIDIDKNTAGQNSIDVLIRTCFAEDKDEAICDTCEKTTMQTSEYHLNRPPGVLLVQNTGESTVAEFEFVNLAHGGAQHAKYRACVVVCKGEDGATSVHRRVPHADTWELRRPGCSALVTRPNCVDRHQISFLLYEQTSTVAEDNYARNMFLASGA